MNPRVLAVIPARGGSKGIPQKNIRELHGKPLIGYTIEAALDSDVFSRIIVSTDDQRIVDVAQKFGAEVPFIRPFDISTDEATSDSVIKHAIHFFEKHNEEFDIVCKLQPTSPLRTSKHIIESYEMLMKRNVDFVVSVCECEHLPIWTGRLDDTLLMKDFMKNVDRSAGRQSFPKYYRLNGAIYLGRVTAFLENNSFISDKGIAYVMSQASSVDIDNELDLKIAEVLMNYDAF